MVPAPYFSTMNALTRILIGAIAVLVAGLLLPGITIGDMGTVDGLLTAVLTAAILALLNDFVKPLLVLLTLPITIVTLGLFLLVLNALLVMLADKLVPGFTIDPPRFWWALGFSLIVSFVQGLLGRQDRQASRARD